MRDTIPMGFVSTQPPPPAFKKCGCGAEYTKEEWLKLPFVGNFDLDEDDDQKGEMRNCGCGSSISIDRTTL